MSGGSAHSVARKRPTGPSPRPSGSPTPSVMTKIAAPGSRVIGNGSIGSAGRYGSATVALVDTSAPSFLTRVIGDHSPSALSANADVSPSGRTTPVRAPSSRGSTAITATTSVVAIVPATSEDETLLARAASGWLPLSGFEP